MPIAKLSTNKFAVLIMKFDIAQDFTDQGLLKIQPTLTILHFSFLASFPHGMKANLGHVTSQLFNFLLQSKVDTVTSVLSANLKCKTVLK